MSIATALIGYAQSRGKSTDGILQALATERRQSVRAVQPGGRGGGPIETMPPGKSYPIPKATGGFLQLPTGFKSTHMTSGLGWPSVDIMAKAGTVVGAPEAGRVLYWHPEGAQGGGSIMFDPSAPGPNYWLGHLDAGVPPGFYKKGQRIALVSSRHAAPHVHEARDY